MNRHLYKDEGLTFSVGFASLDWGRDEDQYVPNGCTWYRCILPAQQLNLAGIHASFGFLSIKQNGKFVIKRLNDTFSHRHRIIVLKVIMSAQTLEAMPKAQALGQKIVVDIDDLHEELHETNHAHASTDPSKSKENNREIYAEIIKNADALICSTPFIEQYYKNKYPKKPIFMVRNAIDIDRWTRFKTVKRKPIIGWLGATPWRSLDLEQISPFFNDYLVSRDARFHHAGHIPWAGPAYLRLNITPDLCSVSPMVPLYDLPNVYANFDIGIVPLNDIPFNRAKSFIKGIEYAAAGIPFVASNLPEYKYLADAGVGRVASSREEWEHHLDSFMNVAKREEESRNARVVVSKNFSIAQTASQWIEVFNKIAEL